jgi:TPP-dependent pyruvate/acetoin dehydrogenase alpha subunit
LQRAGEQSVKAWLIMCTIREFAERMHKQFTTGQISGFGDRYPGTHRGHGRSIRKGAES